MTRFRWVILWLFFFITGIMFAQTTPNNTVPSPQKTKIFKLIYAGLIEKKDTLYEGNPLFTKSVHFEYDNATLKCDSAVYNKQRNNFKAFSNVNFSVRDTLQITSNSLSYNGNTRLATAKGNVILNGKEGILMSDVIYYNRTNQTAYYNTGGTLVSKENTITSTNGTYYVNEKKTVFTQNVKVINKDNTILADEAISYNNNSKIEFIGNVKMDNKDYKITTQKTIYYPKQNKLDFFTNTTIVDKNNPSNVINTNNGVFYTKNKETYLNSRSTVSYGTKYLTGDKLYFNQSSGFGRAQGNVVIEEPLYERFIKGEYAEVHRKKDSAFVTKRAVAVKSFGKDSLYLHADTLFAVINKNKESVVKAYHRAKFYKSNLQGKSDSITFNETKGILSMHKKPIMWFGHSQLTGNVIHAYTVSKSEKMDSILVKGDAFIINKVDTINVSNKDFNQTKGNILKATFNRLNQVDTIKIMGNAQSLIYLDEDEPKTKTKKRIGINISNCGIILVSIQDKKLRNINCEINADSKIFPESKLPYNNRFFDNFFWRYAERLKSSKELFKSD